jgi:CheY-like chemotaxis protein
VIDVDEGSRRGRPISGTTPRIGRVLIVDDEKLLAETLRRVLCDEFDVNLTTDPAEALRWLTSGDWYDVILCDVMMPTMNGVELRNRVHATRPDLACRIVFVTGGITWAHVRKLLESVPNTVLAKPFDFPALRDLIRRRTVSEPPSRQSSQG